MTTLPRRRDVFVALVAVVWSGHRAAAQKPQPAVGARWERVPALVRLGRRARVTLRVMASEDAPRLTIRLLPTDGVEIVGSAAPRAATLKRGKTLALPVAFRVVSEGSWTLGASVTNTQPDDEQVSGAVLTIVAKSGLATISIGAPGSMSNPVIGARQP